jgi:hypothetical protein
VTYAVSHSSGDTCVQKQHNCNTLQHSLLYSFTKYVQQPQPHFEFKGSCHVPRTNARSAPTIAQPIHCKVTCTDGSSRIDRRAPQDTAPPSQNDWPRSCCYLSSDAKSLQKEQAVVCSMAAHCHNVSWQLRCPSHKVKNSISTLQGAYRCCLDMR